MALVSDILSTTEVLIPIKPPPLPELFVMSSPEVTKVPGLRISRFFTSKLSN